MVLLFLALAVAWLYFPGLHPGVGEFPVGNGEEGEGKAPRGELCEDWF